MGHALASAFTGLAAAAMLGGCASLSPPTTVSNACQIFAQKPDWWRAVRRSEARWGALPALQLSIIYQESSFTHDARPPRLDGFLFFPGKRPSSAFGYAQALDQTWREYAIAVGDRGVDRDEFRDAADFVGWYVAQSRARLNLQFTDFKAHYLAYHEGHGGYRRGTYRGKAWLLQAAAKVEANARTYQTQLNGCERKLNGAGWWPF
jgi:hypothetical protein